MNHEMFDVVDEQDRVIGQAPRHVVHAEKLLHRAVHIFVFDEQGRMYVQLRSAHKDEYPLCWTSSCSGHVDSGETYDVAAVRELREELGIIADPAVRAASSATHEPIDHTLTRLRKFPASERTSYEHTVLYHLRSDEELNPDPHEIAGGDFRTLAEIEADIASQPDRYCPAFKVLFAWYISSSSDKF